MNAYPHRMRLRAPWKSEPTESGVCHRRGFGSPRRLDDFERLWLVVNWEPGTSLESGRVSLNGRPLEPGTEFDITDRLEPRNEVTIESPAGRVWSEVVLEVRCPAWLRDLHARAHDGGLTVEGTVAGRSDEELELYVIAGRFNIGYATVAPFAGTTPFRVAAETAPGPGPLRVELVRATTVWYGADLEIST